jgi:putative colanic acid biosynthesis UDP-glucose lipid carrier transferase
MNVIRNDIDMASSVAVSGVGDAFRPGRKWPISYDSVELITVVTDACMILAASIFAGVVYHYRAFGTPGDIIQYIGSATVVAALFISLMKSRGMYRPKELLVLRTQIRTICLLWVAVFFLLAGTVFALKVGSELSRGTCLLFAVIGLSTLVVHRIFWRSLLAKGVIRRRFSGRRVVLITDHRQSAEAGLPDVLTSLGFRLERHFALPPPELGGRERQEIISKAIASVRGSEVEEILVSADLNHWPELRGLLAELRILPFPVNLVPVGAVSEIFKHPHHELGNAVCIEVQRGPLTRFEYASKRCMDVVFAGIGLIALLPVLALVAIAIKLDSPGPILFRQRRCGFNGRCFQILKFRTMRVQAEDGAVTQAQRRDARVTRLGRLLRRTSIDELPQLLNVLAGSMSLIGPRPHAEVHDTHFDKIVRNYAFRHRVKPGLTGWAQVHGCRGPTPTPKDIERRVEYDLWYIDNWSFALDFSIMLQTAVELVRGRNAY